MTKFDDEDIDIIRSDSEKEATDSNIGVGRGGGENGDGDSDVPEEVNTNDESIKLLKELHNQIKSSTDRSRIKSSKKNSKAMKSGTAASERNARKEEKKRNDDEELDISVMGFLDTRDEYDSEEDEGIKNRNNKTKVRDSDVIFRIDKDAIRSRKLGSITVATISENSSSALGSIYDAFPVNASVLSFNSSRHNSRERVSLSRFNSFKQVGPSKVFSKSKNK